jgi:hypothetical protein
MSKMPLLFALVALPLDLAASKEEVDALRAGLQARLDKALERQGADPAFGKLISVMVILQQASNAIKAVSSVAVRGR